MERLELRVPMDARVRDIDASADGFIVFEAFPGLTFHFGHVTPAPGLARGSQVTAGQIVATMYQLNGFDFGVVNYGIEHRYIVSSRYAEAYLHAEHPIAQFPGAVRTELLTRVNSLSATPLGRISFDVDGTASGGWFVEGSPTARLTFASEPYLLWLARYVERDETRIASFGETWPGMENWLLAVDPAGPDWETVTPASGVVAVHLWQIGRDARPDLERPGGTLLLQMLDGRRLRMEWFNTHELVAGFTAASKVFVR
jgi:hypothetical protein